MSHLKILTIEYGLDRKYHRVDAQIGGTVTLRRAKKFHNGRDGTSPWRWAEGVIEKVTPSGQIVVGVDDVKLRFKPNGFERDGYVEYEYMRTNGETRFCANWYIATREMRAADAAEYGAAEKRAKTAHQLREVLLAATKEASSLGPSRVESDKRDALMALADDFMQLVQSLEVEGEDA